jgi:hypothetical protein
MPDVFWLGELSLLPDKFTAGLRELGLKADWIQEAHGLGEAVEVPVKAVYQWPEEPAAAHRLLHFACQALQSGDLDLLLLASGSHAAALASPKAAGRWNLLPRASLSARFSYPPGTPPDEFLPALALQLAAAGIDSEQTGCAAAAGQFEFPLAPAFPAVNWLENNPDLLGQLNRVCSELETQSADLGLLFSPGLATVIERV